MDRVYFLAFFNPHGDKYGAHCHMAIRIQRLSARLGGIGYLLSGEPVQAALAIGRLVAQWGYQHRSVGDALDAVGGEEPAKLSCRAARLIRHARTACAESAWTEFSHPAHPRDLAHSAPGAGRARQ